MKIWLTPGVIFWDSGQGYNILYHGQTQKKYHINETVVQILKRCNGNQSLQELVNSFPDEMADELQETTTTLLENHIITQSKQSMIKNRKYKEVDTFYISLTGNCNLNCQFCLKKSSFMEKRDELRLSEWKKILSLLAQFNNCTPKTLYLTGGEPTLYSKFSQVYGYATDLGFQINLFSNGTLMDKRIFDCLLASPPHAILFSIDGSTKMIHDQIRGVSGAFSQVIDATRKVTRMLQETKIVWQVVVNQNNVHDVENLVKLAIENNVKLIRFSIITSIGRGSITSLNLSSDQIANFWHQEILLARKYKNQVKINRPLTKTSRKQTEEMFFNQHNCGIGNILHIDESGNLTPCYGLIEPPFRSNPICSLRELSRNEIQNYFYEYSLETYRACSQCGLRYFCFGGCRAEIYHLTGTIHGCNIEKRNAMIKFLNKIFLN